MQIKHHDPAERDASRAPIDISVGRQLFVDDWLVEDTRGVVRAFYHPTKAFDAPVIWPETALEREVDPSRPYRFAPVAGANSGGLWWDPVKKVFRLWYEAGWMKYLCYLESQDGLVWERKDLGVVKGTNRVLTDTLLDSWCVFPDYVAADPYRNWRLMVSVAGIVTDNRLYTSPDGIAWTHIGNAGQSGDRSTMFYDPFRGKWVFSLRSGVWDGSGRRRSYWASGTFGGETCLWSFPNGDAPGLHPDLPLPKPWLATDERDLPDPSTGGNRPELYNMDAVAYESIMLGLFEILHPLTGDNEACEKAGLPKITDLHFAFSRDGWHFDRPDRTAAIAASRWGSGKWDTGYLSPTGGICVIKDERLWFYYTAFRGDATETSPYSGDPAIGHRRNGMHFNGSIGVATLRRDGFAGLVADGLGEVTTKPVTLSGKHLFVNAECRFGSLAAEVLDEAGNILPGFAAAECIPLALTDSTKAEIVWKGGALASLAGRAVRFRFKLHCATLYSFWVSQTERGESRGYVAAGGPAYQGLRDL